MRYIENNDTNSTMRSTLRKTIQDTDIYKLYTEKDRLDLETDLSKRTEQLKKYGKKWLSPEVQKERAETYQSIALVGALVFGFAATLLYEEGNEGANHLHSDGRPKDWKKVQITLLAFAVILTASTTMIFTMLHYYLKRIIGLEMCIEDTSKVGQLTQAFMETTLATNSRNFGNASLIFGIICFTISVLIKVSYTYDDWTITILLTLILVPALIMLLGLAVMLSASFSYQKLLILDPVKTRSRSRATTPLRGGVNFMEPDEVDKARRQKEQLQDLQLPSMSYLDANYTAHADSSDAYVKHSMDDPNLPDSTPELPKQVPSSQTRARDKAKSVTMPETMMNCGQLEDQSTERSEPSQSC